MIDFDYFNRLWDCPEGSYYNPRLGSGVHFSTRVRVDRRSNAIHVHPITAGSTKLPEWLIGGGRDLGKQGAHKKGNRKLGSHTEDQLPNFIVLSL